MSERIKEHNRQLKSKNSGRYPWDKIEKEGYCSVCAIEKGSPTCEKCKHKEEKCECYTCVYAPNKECGWYAACNNCIDGSNYLRKSEEV